MAERRPEDFDRDFRAMVSGLEMDGEKAPVEDRLEEPPDLRLPPETPRGHHGGEGTPVSGPRTDASGNDPEWFSLERSLAEAEPDEPSPEEYKPPPLPPPSAPSGRATIGWICFGYTVLILVLTLFNARVHIMLAWLALPAFVAAMVIGFLGLPKNRDDQDNDGAVV